jgi:hypothetical protein
VSDHGFLSADKLILPNVAFRKAGLMRLAATTAPVRAKAQAISEGGTALVYLTDPETAAADREKVVDLLRGQEGIAEIIGPEQFDKYGYPRPENNPQMGNLVLVAKDGYAFFNTPTGDDFIVPAVLGKTTVGFHGYLSTNEKMNAVFIAAGRGIQRGAKLGLIDNTDVAPTAARLLGHDLKDAEGTVLADVLAEKR